VADAVIKAHYSAIEKLLHKEQSATSTSSREQDALQQVFVRMGDRSRRRSA
jgi:hypothetical protein